MDRMRMNDCACEHNKMRDVEVIPCHAVIRILEGKGEKQGYGTV